MSNRSEKYTQQFERKLIGYQKSAFMVLLHPLVTVFVFIVLQFGQNFGEPLRMGYSLLMTAFWPEVGIWHYLIHVLVLAGFTILVILGVKGKIWATTAAASIYLTDFILIFFILDKINVVSFILSIVLHVAFLVSSVFAQIYYYQASAYLKTK